MPINYAQALLSNTPVPTPHNRPASETHRSTKLFTWLQGIKSEVSLLLEKKRRLQGTLDALKKLKTCGSKNSKDSHIFDDSEHTVLLTMIQDLEITEQQQLDLTNESISLNEFMSQLNEQIKGKEVLIAEGAEMLTEMCRQYKSLEKSSVKISASFSSAIFEQFSKNIAARLKDLRIEKPSDINTLAKSERLWMHYVDFTLRFADTDPKTSEEALMRIKFAIDGLSTISNFENLMAEIRGQMDETQYLLELGHYQSFKTEFTEKCTVTLDWALNAFSSKILNKADPVTAKTDASALKFLGAVLQQLKGSRLCDAEKFELFAAGPQKLINSAFKEKPELKKMREISLCLFKKILLQRQNNIDEQNQLQKSIDLLKTSLERKVFELEKNQTYLKLIQDQSKRMKQNLKKLAETCVSVTDREITRTWLGLDECKIEISTLLNNKLVRRGGNERGLFTADAIKGVLNRHLMTETQLKARLEKNEHLKAASSYKDEVAFIEALQTTVITKLKQPSEANKHLHLEHSTPIEGLSLIRHASGNHTLKPITHSMVSFNKTSSEFPLITHLYPCAD